MQKQTVDIYDFEERLVDGVVVYYKNIPTSPCINVRVVFKNGAFDDPIGKEGLAHFFEHLIFTGSPKIEDKKAVKAWSKKYALGSFNAGTSYSYTGFQLRCFPLMYMDAISGMKDMIFNPFLRDEDIEQERKVILQEAWGRYSNEKFLNYNIDCFSIMFPNHVHGHISSPLGWPSTIEKITRDDIVDYHKKYYGKGNFFVVLSGAVTDEHINAWGEVLKDIEYVSESKTDYGTIDKPKVNRIEKNSKDIGRELEKVEIAISRTMPPKEIFDRYCIRNLARLLKDILYERLRIEQALCYGVSVSASFSNTYGSINMSIRTDEENVALVESEFRKALDEIENGLHVERFVNIKNLYLEQVGSYEALSSDIADTVLSEVIAHGRPIGVNEELENIEKVLYDDMIRLSKELFLPEYTLTEVIYPAKKEN